MNSAKGLVILLVSVLAVVSLHSNIAPVHADNLFPCLYACVTNIIPFVPVYTAGDLVFVRVTVYQGSAVGGDCYNITLFVNATIVSNRQGTVPFPGGFAVDFPWNTAGYAAGKYVFSATQACLSNQLFVGGSVELLPAFVGSGLVCITFPVAMTSCPLSPFRIGPVTVGQTYTVGVFVNGSKPIGGYDISVAVNPAYLNPIGATLGSLILNPSLTIICINNNPIVGACTSNSANGPPSGSGVVEVSTIENTGLNDCNGVLQSSRLSANPCSGLAFAITYRVVAPVAATPISYLSSPGFCEQFTSVAGTSDCVVLGDSLGGILPENIQGATFLQEIVPPAQIHVLKFFTDSSLNPLPLDSHGNPKVDVVLARGIVESTNPGQVLAWVNVTNTGSAPFQSLKLNETLPVDWTVDPPWLPAKGAIHVYFANTTGLATNPDITQPKTITVTISNPQTVILAISNLNATDIGHPLMPGQSILLSVKLTYGLIKTTRSFASYPRNYTDTATSAAWTQPFYAGTVASGTGSTFFIAYAKVVGDPGGDTPIVDVSKYAIV